MVNFRKLAAQAKKAVDAAGGTDAVKEKAADLKKVAQGPGSLSDKAKRAAEVVREKEDSTAAKPATAATPKAAATEGTPAAAPAEKAPEPNPHPEGDGGPDRA